MSFTDTLKTRNFWQSILAMFLITVALLVGTRFFLNYITHHGQEVLVPNVEGLTITEAETKLDDAGLNYQIDSVNFNEKVKPFIVYRQDPGKGLTVKEGRAIILKVNPHAPRPVKLPSIYEKSYRLAEQQLLLDHLKIGKITFEPNIAKDAVLKVIYNGKIIRPGMLLPKYATVDLVLGQGYNETITIPDLYGMTLEEAQQELTLAHIQFGLATERNVTDRNSARVYDQNPGAGSIVEQGQRLNVFITNDELSERESQSAPTSTPAKAKVDTTHLKK